LDPIGCGPWGSPPRVCVQIEKGGGMRRGKRPLPAAVKHARGTLRKVRENPQAPVLSAPSRLDPPSDLKGRGLGTWLRLVRELVEKGVLRDSDMETFATYCRRLTLLERVERLADQGVDLAIAKGYANLTHKLTEQVRKLAAELGLTPSSRAGVKAIEPKKPGELHQFLRPVK
jgi:P27 family predicted phage terminase small subunit